MWIMWPLLLASLVLANHAAEIWGPGVDSLQYGDLPIRHFFVLLKDKRSYVNVDISGGDVNGNRCRVQTEIIDRHDASYLVRYKALSACHGIYINVRGHAQFNLSGSFDPAECACSTTTKEWASQLQCPLTYSQITEDLKPWPLGSVNFGNVVKTVENTWAKHPGAYSLCHYVIRNNQIWRKCYGQHVGFNMFSDAILIFLARRMHLPDTELLMNLGDWPLQKANAKSPLPIVSWCGSKDTKDILLPTYELTEATLNMMGRQSLDVMSVQGYRTPPWSHKYDMALFRGRDSRQERLDLVLLANKYPDYLNASITRYFFFRDQIDTYGQPTGNLPFGDFFKYRYQVNVDGTVAAYRLAYLLGGDCVVLKQNSPYYEHFYSQIHPWQHYIPLNRDLSDVIEKIDWARNHPSQVQQIIHNAQQFVEEELMPKDIYCYHLRLIQQYSTILDENYKSKLDSHEQIASGRPSHCPPCPSSKSMKTEL